MERKLLRMHVELFAQVGPLYARTLCTIVEKLPQPNKCRNCRLNEYAKRKRTCLSLSPFKFGQLLLLVLEIAVEAAHELSLGVEDALEVGVRREDAVVLRSSRGGDVDVRRRDDRRDGGAKTKGGD